jgi:Enterochelin esterase and related enzymes
LIHATFSANLGGYMKTATDAILTIETVMLKSRNLKRDVELRFYFPNIITDWSALPLLLINDGQDLPVMQFDEMLKQLYEQGSIHPLIVIGITAGKERTMEYGVAGVVDYKGRGAKADLYSAFVLKELLPYIKKRFKVSAFKELSFAGFSLGGLTALDIVWNHPDVFSKVGVFSGSLWWRSVDQDDPSYEDDKHRIMQQVIRNGHFAPGLKFFFQCGKLDESGDRNNNGIIDSIDDTLDHIKELLAKGYRAEDISYLELDDGKHDVPTWGKAMPVFLKWGWGK